jgi:hypothetical protein
MIEAKRLIKRYRKTAGVDEVSFVRAQGLAPTGGAVR